MSLAHTTYTLSPDARAALDAGDIDALLAIRRAQFGGWFMEDEGTEGDESDEGEDGNEDESAEDGDDSEDTDKDKDASAKRASRQAAKYRTELRETQAQLKAATAVLDKLKSAFGGDEDEDPTEKATKAAAKVTELEDERNALRAQLLVTTLAGKHKANAEALLDSQKFTKTLAGLDPTDDDYEDQVAEAIKSAVSKNAAFRAGQGSGKGGAEMDPEKRERTKGKRPSSIGAAVSAAYRQ